MFIRPRPSFLPAFEDSRPKIIEQESKYLREDNISGQNCPVAGYDGMNINGYI